MRRAALALAAVLGVTSCGLGVQPGPEPVDIPRPSTAESGPPGALDGPRVTVWFVRGSRLEPVERPTDRPGIDAALDALVVGPTRAEVVDGLRTALSPQSLMPDRPASGHPVVTVEVAREFTEVAGGNQLLATAQVVFTVTGFPGVETVRITADGSPVEVPTDDGLTAEPVGRDDYASVAAPERSPTPTAPSTGADAPTGNPAMPTGNPSMPTGNPSMPTGTRSPAAPSTPGRRRPLRAAGRRTPDGMSQDRKAGRVPGDPVLG
ncbi:hypothetical protein E4P41_14080 [Geodermatophilus sp. DF01-2]|uniref:GerMN domain-containing protein n=1 Tax=Geodermatophilus sp. DF01-2 TaxID=2559610 RepID=UPI00107478AA|nr:GerMN domain-containing protein [Geodermatophilus sp. DF01_2]TFV57712.1 hypothetical protein E4P41_14080 [Geodermatophilus sp. DF01_2]